MGTLSKTSRYARSLEAGIHITYFGSLQAYKNVIQLNLSTTATLGTEESGICKEVETRVNVWTVRQKKKWPL